MNNYIQKNILWLPAIAIVIRHNNLITEEETLLIPNQEPADGVLDSNYHSELKKVRKLQPSVLDCQIPRTKTLTSRTKTLSNNNNG